MTCFWELGFDAASIAALEAASGINRRQLSRDYGNKRGLFLQALDDFHAFAASLYLERMEADGAGRDAIAATLADLADLPNAPVGHLGCLISNTSLQPIHHADAEVQERVHAFFARIERAYLAALETASTRGEVTVPSDELGAAARQLLGTHIALLMLARSRMPAETLADVARRALATLGEAP